MSLFQSLNLARLSLAAHQTAIQTVGQNIANANTEGYARQRVQFTPTPSDDLIFARLGTGVTIQQIERIVDQHLETTLRESRTDLAAFSERDRIFSMAESIFNDLDGGGLSESLSRFFDSLEDLANNPQDPTVRSLVIQEGLTLTETFHFLDARVRDLRSGLDEDIVGVVQDINRLTTDIARLNRNIVLAEDGGNQPGAANDLRTQRDAMLGELAQLVDIRVVENSRGSVQVVTGSDVLVQDSRARELQLRSSTDGDITFHEARFVDDGQRLTSTGGRLGALREGRDDIAIDLRGELDQMATTLLTVFNEIHTSGEGLGRYTTLRAGNSVVDPDVPLAEAGFPFPIRDGSFDFQIFNEGDDTRQTYRIPIDADGADPETTLRDIAQTIQNLVGADHPEITARVTLDGFLEVESSDSSLSFTFREDTSGFLSAAGIHTFFTGTNARDIGVSNVLQEDTSLLTTGRGGAAGDNSAVLDMLSFRDRSVLGADGKTLEGFYDAFIGRIGIQGAEARDLLRNQQAITDTVSNQRESISGVNVDEESIELIQLQRAYQGSARFLTVVDSLLETLINSV